MSDWQPIESAPDLERVMVAGWRNATYGCRGYWWWGEDVCDKGVAIEKPNATLWCPIILPAFPPEQDQ